VTLLGTDGEPQYGMVLPKIMLILPPAPERR
jgi:hypothetical protein